MNTEKKIQSVKELKNAVSQLQLTQPWSLITTRDSNLLSRLYNALETNFPTEIQTQERKRFIPLMVALTLASFILVCLFNGPILIAAIVVVITLLVLVKRHSTIQDLLIKKKAEVARLIKEQVDAEILDYEESIFKQQKELDALSQHDPLKELTKEKDSKYGYMSPEQLKAYWQEVELPLRQQELQERINKWNDELAYIRKEFALLEEIEKS